MNFQMRRGLLAAVALAAFVAGPVAADELDDDDVITGQFTQRGFDDGGRVRVRFWGRDTDGDGVLYSMSGFLAANLPLFDPESDGAPLPVGNEFIRVELTLLDVFGIPRVRQVFDERETPIDLTPNFGPTAFFGFVYNIGSGRMSDEANEGISFAPLAPSISYVTGELFRFLLGPESPQLLSCAPGSGEVCGAVQQLKPGPTGLDLINETYSDKRIKVKQLRKWNQCEAD